MSVLWCLVSLIASRKAMARFRLRGRWQRGMFPRPRCWKDEKDPKRTLYCVRLQGSAGDRSSREPGTICPRAHTATDLRCDTIQLVGSETPERPDLQLVTEKRHTLWTHAFHQERQVRDDCRRALPERARPLGGRALCARRLGAACALPTPGAAHGGRSVRAAHMPVAGCIKSEPPAVDHPAAWSGKDLGVNSVGRSQGGSLGHLLCIWRARLGYGQFDAIGGICREEAVVGFPARPASASSRTSLSNFDP